GSTSCASSIPGMHNHSSSNHRIAFTEPSLSCRRGQRLPQTSLYNGSISRLKQLRPPRKPSYRRHSRPKRARIRDTTSCFLDDPVSVTLAAFYNLLTFLPVRIPDHRRDHVALADYPGAADRQQHLHDLCLVRPPAQPVG